MLPCSTRRVSFQVRGNAAHGTARGSQRACPARVARRDLALEIAGQGNDRRRLERLARALGVADTVRFLGFVSDEEKRRLMRRAWAVVLSSRKEGWGISNVEAAACGTPALASDSPGLRESVRDGETGFLVPLEQHTESPFEALDPDKFARDLAEKINVLMRDPELRKRFGQAGRKRAVEKFSWHAIALATKKMYAELIAK